MAKTYQGTKLQDLGNLEVLDPTDKIVIVKPKDEGVMQLSEFFFFVQQNLDLSNYYTTIQTKALFAEKTVVYTKGEADGRFAFLDRVYSKVQSDTKYALNTETYTKEQSDNRYAGIDFTYGKTELYTKDETFRTFALKTELPPLVDLSPYSTTAKGDLRWAMSNETYSKIDADARFSPLDRSYNKSDSDGRFAKILTTYTKEETDSKFLDVDEAYTRTFIQNNVYFKPELYTRLESDTRFALKNNVYTVAAINEQFASKSWVYSRGDAEATFAPIATTFTKTEINTLVDGRVNPVVTNLSLNYYTKDNADAKYATKALTYSRLESDAKYALISNTLTEQQLITKYYDKTQVDAKFTAIDWTPYLTKVVATATYATKDTTLTKDAIETAYYTKAQVNDAIAAAKQGLEVGSAERYITSAYAEERYANVNSVYTKTVSDGKYATLELTYSRLVSDERYYLKAQVDTAINDKAVTTLDTVATNYLTKVDAGNTYITTTMANNTLANKTTVYTKSEADVRYAVKDSSYLKAEADGRYLKVGLDALTVTSAAASGSGALINLNNSNATNLEAGRIVWNNDTHSIGNLRISNTVTKEAYFTLDLRPNFVTNPTRALTVTPTYIEHSQYGKLHTYFALTDTVYTKAIIDSLLNDIRSTHTNTATANARYATITNLGLLETTVSTLSGRVTADRANVDNNYYAKVDLYNKTQSDTRYHQKDATKLSITGAIVDTGVDVNSSNEVANESGFVTGNYSFSHKGTKIASINAHNQTVPEAIGHSITMSILTNGTLKPTVSINKLGIVHEAYGSLHTYFAKAENTYTKVETDNKFDFFSTARYTKTESDARYPLKSEFTTLAGRVTTEEGKLATLSGNLNTNYYDKTSTYSKTETNSRYLSSLSNEVLLTSNAGDSNTLALHISAPAGSTTLGGIKWSRGSDVYTMNTIIPADGKGKLQFSKVTGGTTTAYAVVSQDSIWHSVYGDLHTYFAKVSDVYTKTEADGKYYTKADADSRYHQKGVTYTRTEMDSRYSLITDGYTKSETDGKYALKAFTYLKTETDAKYPAIGDVYTKTESDAKYPLKADGYTKAQSDANYYTKTVADGRYLYKADAYTKAESDTRYLVVNPAGTTLNLNLADIESGFSSAGLILNNTNTSSNTSSSGYLTGNLSFKAGGSTRGSFGMSFDTYYFTGFNAAKTSVNTLLTVGAEEIYTLAYGSLQDYFAKVSDVYTKTQTDAKYALKADAYTKAESDGRYHQKAVTYTRTEMDARYEYVGVGYTKAESDAKYPLKAASYLKAETFSKTEADARFEGINVAYNKASSDARYYLKSQTYSQAETHSVAQADAKFELKDVAYTKAQSDAAYPAKADFITNTKYVDTRNANIGPLAYFTSYGTGVFKEFKTASAIGLTAVSGYVELTTRVYYPDASGGWPVQSVQTSDNRIFIRSGINNTTWTAWEQVETASSAASKFYTKGQTYSQAETHSVAQADARFELKGVAYTKAQGDARYEYVGVAYNKAQGDARYVYQSDVGVNSTRLKVLTEDSGYTIRSTDTQTIPDAALVGHITGGAYCIDIYIETMKGTKKHSFKVNFVGDTTASGNPNSPEGMIIGNLFSENGAGANVPLVDSLMLLNLTNSTHAVILVTKEPGVIRKVINVAQSGGTGVFTPVLPFIDVSGVFNGTATLPQLVPGIGGNLASFGSTVGLSQVQGTKVGENYFTKSESDQRYAPTNKSYSKYDSDSRYSGKTDTFTKTESETRYHQKGVTYTRTEMDARYPLKTQTYSKSESDAQNNTFALKSSFTDTICITRNLGGVITSTKTLPTPRTIVLEGIFKAANDTTDIIGEIAVPYLTYLNGTVIIGNCWVKGTYGWAPLPGAVTGVNVHTQIETGFNAGAWCVSVSNSYAIFKIRQGTALHTQAQSEATAGRNNIRVALTFANL